MAVLRALGVRVDDLLRDETSEVEKRLRGIRDRTWTLQDPGLPIAARFRS